MTDDTLRAALEQLRDHGYQPMYNGRPSCPFCSNFVDDEQTHRTGCLLVAALAASATDGPRDGRLDRYLRHGATCALQAVRDNPPDDENCTCGLRELFLAALASAPAEGPKSAWQQFDEEWRAEHAASAPDTDTLRADSHDIWWRCRCHDVLLNECPNRDRLRAALASAPDEGPPPGNRARWILGIEDARPAAAPEQTDD